jgi:hypothetical protein
MEVRLNGKCYPKCTSCVNGVSVSKDCACGTGTDDNAYRLVNKDSYCCPLTGGSYADAQSCNGASTKTSTNTNTNSAGGSAG